MAAPPPIQKSLGDDQGGDLERQRFLEQEEGEGRAPEEDVSPPYQQKKPEDYAGDEKPVPKLLTELYTISYLILLVLSFA